MLPAAAANDCDAFGESVYRYGVRAGMCFAQQQGGPFANPQLQDWVAAIRRRGVRGVGQSSWGPTLFALLPSQADAEELVTWCRHELADPDANIQPTISPIANHGARLTSGTA